MKPFNPDYARRTLLISLVSVGMGFTVLFPILAPLGREIGLSEVQITFIIGASAMMVFLGSPIWGRASDRWGRKRVLLIGLFGFTAGTVLFNLVLYAGLAGALTGLGLFVALVVARMLHAAMMAAAMPAANAYMADITTAENRTKGMGAAGAANNFGAILGPAVAGLAVISMLTPLWVMAAVALLNGLFVWRFLPEPPRLPSPRVPPPFTLLRMAMPLLIVAFTMMALVESQLWLSAAMMIQGFGMGLAGPGFMAGASLAVSPEEQGAVAGVAGSCGPLGFAIGPLIGGLLYRYNPSLPYAVAAGMYVLLFLAMFWIGRRVTVHR